MKKRDLEQRLSLLGWYFLRHGGSHEVWTNGEHIIVVPRHREIIERTALEIIKLASMNRRNYVRKI